jgi:hypothetical protein
LALLPAEQRGGRHTSKQNAPPPPPRRRPRAAQAEALLAAEPVHLAVNLGLREEVLVEKCMGRRLCSKCGKNWNVADIYLPAEVGPAPDALLNWIE